MKKIFISVFAVMLIFSLTGCESADGKSYKEAVSLYEAGQYEDARTLFLELGDYKDSLNYAQNCSYGIDYEKGKQALEDGEFESAIYWLSDLGDFEDSQELLRQAKFGGFSEYLQATSGGNSFGVVHKDGSTEYAIIGESPEHISFWMRTNSALLWLNIYKDGSASMTYNFWLDSEKGEIPVDISTYTAGIPLIPNATTYSEEKINDNFTVMMFELLGLLDENSYDITEYDLGFFSLWE